MSEQSRHDADAPAESPVLAEEDGEPPREPETEPEIEETSGDDVSALDETTELEDTALHSEPADPDAEPVEVAAQAPEAEAGPDAEPDTPAAEAAPESESADADTPDGDADDEAEGQLTTGDSPAENTDDDAQDSEAQPVEENSEEADQETPVVLAEPPASTGVAPIITTSSGPERGLSGFFDTLDERAKKWWSGRKERKTGKLAQAAAEAEGTEPPAPVDSTELPAPEVPPASPVSFPEPPPAEQRPFAQLFTGMVPVVPPPPGTQSAEAAAEPQLTEPPLPEDGEAQAPSSALGADPESTTVLPAYRDQDEAPKLPRPGRREPEDAERKRNLIAQKAAAIEAATTDNPTVNHRTRGYIRTPEAGYEFADDEEDLYTYIPPYNMPSRDPDPEPNKWDLYRRIAVTVGAVMALISTMWMLGWFGSSEENPAILSGSGLKEIQSDGWFSGDYALLTPDHNWYWIWPAITLALGAHCAFQWRAPQESTPRQRRTGWFVAGSSALMLVVTASLYLGYFTLGLLASLAIAGLLTEAIRQFNLYTARNTTERRLTDAIVGLFYGFALVQAMSSISAWLTSRGWDIPGIPALLWALIGLLGCVWTAAFYSMTERGRITIALGLAWGLFWLIFPRILGEATSVWVAIGAAMGAFIVILATQSRRHRINHAERRAAMGRPLEDII
ncbi:hypothetical protein HGQ17_06500 [Nesterenkonia sp. MY13]|uniref:Uncharacterized protein n=1 Tax=Nesterenkonia sedimenti TaxID=1463632 RepID=A0A7X8TJI0_9MICC|nr:hypothetical protein [Nesterenkonia sedimenti]NLS09660.1 hypothetical protein [Nesterenkonia sedimenti]